MCILIVVAWVGGGLCIIVLYQSSQLGLVEEITIRIETLRVLKDKRQVVTKIFRALAETIDNAEDICLDMSSGLSMLRLATNPSWLDSSIGRAAV